MFTSHKEVKPYIYSSVLYLHSYAVYTFDTYISSIKEFIQKRKRKESSIKDDFHFLPLQCMFRNFHPHHNSSAFPIKSKEWGIQFHLIRQRTNGRHMPISINRYPEEHSQRFETHNSLTDQHKEPEKALTKDPQIQL